MLHSTKNCCFSTIARRLEQSGTQEGCVTTQVTTEASPPSSADEGNGREAQKRSKRPKKSNSLYPPALWAKTPTILLCGGIGPERMDGMRKGDTQKKKKIKVCSNKELTSENMLDIAG
ncbi:hypothetical protein EJB05_22799 [Eragrostis curvula]|uniref:Uncharacterized protein n=1 Tax=Eragrostis curvula TaxID=38414 RepID=A0A5J9V6J5_9POAL|nr:hypothetical protein EJB05_22799 [Eragrostis curvula]